MHKNKKIIFFSHVLIWFVLFSLPYILSYGQEQEIDRVIAHFWIPLFFYAIIFYLNYLDLIDRFLFAKKTLQFVVLNLLVIAFFLLAKEQIESTFFQDIVRKPSDNDRGGPPFKIMIYVQMILYMAPLLLSIAIKTTKRWARTEAERKEAANIKLQSELQHLRYQLQPHFFFNSLNNIYSLVDISPEQAKTTIHSLSKLMRYLLYETKTELVPLSKEIDFMTKYIDLMKLRLSNKTKIEASFPTGETGIKIAPLLFISLIENAFKHGVSANTESVISLEMTCQEKTVAFNIENYNFPKEDNDKSGSGIGLENLEKRLQLLYPNKHTFQKHLKEGIYSIHLKIET